MLNESVIKLLRMEKEQMLQRRCCFKTRGREKQSTEILFLNEREREILSTEEMLFRTLVQRRHGPVFLPETHMRSSVVALHGNSTDTGASNQAHTKATIDQGPTHRLSLRHHYRAGNSP